MMKSNDKRREPLTDTQLLMGITICIFLAMYLAAMAFLQGGFLHTQQLFDLLNDNASLIIVSCGLTIVMIGGGIDISVGAVTSLVVMSCVLYLNNGGKNDVHLCNIIASCFPKECVLIPYTKTSACKKLNMFLRWMVRDNSPVDLGLWKWFSKKDLLIPMDTHVLQTAADFNLIEKTSSGKIPGATIKMARALTQKMKEVFPEDPCRADFALFGLGVES